jgi:hypothetical protein
MVYLKKPGRITLKKEHMVLREQIFLFIFYFLLLLGARIFFLLLFLGPDRHAHLDPRTQGAARKDGGGQSLGFRV